ncbi:MAG: ATP-binding cassette domain-containing protein [Ruminiclostridium sp.]|nr:ATP-binding cassette domain-containing protein [Ruminiclostridium sp.]
MLIAKDLCKSYGGVPVIDSFSHGFTEGGVTAVMGASGCGKTTLLSLLMGIINPDSGEIAGNDVRISAVFQEDRLCANLTVLANLKLVLPGKPDRAMLERELAAIGLDGCADKPVHTLSGGMKRRTALLRALLAEYDLLFLDEPFKGLDDDTKQSVMSFTKEKTAGKTVILVTHSREEAEFFAAETIML